MAAGVPSTNSIYGPMNRESLQLKSKMGAPMELPGLFYNQYTPTAATISSGTVTNSGLSMVGALQLGSTTAGTLPLGGTAAVTFSSSSGLLMSFTTSSFMPTTLNYDQMPVMLVPTSGAVLPTGTSANTLYYAQWVSATTYYLATTPGGTVIAYTNAGSGTIYCQAATQYWGSPFLPAGALVASDTLNVASANSIITPGCSIHVEIIGHKIGTGTNNYTVTPGFMTGAGTFTALTAGNVQAAVSAGPFTFWYEAEIMIQQYGQAAVTAPYTAIAQVKTFSRQQTFSAAATNTFANNIMAKTVTVDLTQALAIDVRYLAATPVVGEYIEPVICRMWAYN